MLPAFTFLGRQFLSYHVCAALAGLCVILLSARTLRRELSGVWRWLFPVLIALSAVIGARMLNFLLNPDAYGEDFHLWTFSYQKLSLVGGLFTGTLTLLFLCRWKGADLWRTADCFVFPGAAALCFLKLGCFLNGCCYGRKTAGPLGMHFPRLEQTYDFLDRLPIFSVNVRTVYPTQLFELFGYLLGAVLLWLIIKKHPLRGRRALMYGMWVLLVRLAVHPLRMFPYPALTVNVLYPAFYLLLLAALAGCLVWRKWKINYSPNRK